jgi:hypothetical protein
MQTEDMEALVAFAIERLLSGKPAIRRAAVRDMAAAWPDVPALGLVFALTDAAARIDAVLAEDAESKGAARMGYRMAALLAADVFAIEQSGTCPVGAADLRAYWENRDPYFLDL